MKYLEDYIPDHEFFSRRGLSLESNNINSTRAQSCHSYLPTPNCITELSASNFLNIHYFLDACRTRLFGITDGDFIDNQSTATNNLCSTTRKRRCGNRNLMLYAYGNEWYGLGKPKANPHLGDYTTGQLPIGI